jgi:hypothetical protein
VQAIIKLSLLATSRLCQQRTVQAIAEFEQVWQSITEQLWQLPPLGNEKDAWQHET